MRECLFSMDRIWSFGLAGRWVVVGRFAWGDLKSGAFLASWLVSSVRGCRGFVGGGGLNQWGKFPLIAISFYPATARARNRRTGRLRPAAFKKCAQDFGRYRLLFSCAHFPPVVMETANIR